jgi:hypothetical protein
MAADSTLPAAGRSAPDDSRKRSLEESGSRDVQEQVAQTADRARDKVTENLAHQKERATDQLDSVTSALHTTSSNLRDQDQESIAGFVDSAADQVERLASYVRSRRVGELVDDLQDVARREPALFIGGAAMLGILGARFLKSTGHRRSDSDDGRESGSERRIIRPYEAHGDGNAAAHRAFGNGDKSRVQDAW